MIGKFKLKKEFIDCQINTKTPDGRDVSVDKNSFNDQFAEWIIAAGQGHLVELNPLYEPIHDNQKKTFAQISEGVIALTSDPLQNDLKPQSETQKERKPRSDAGKQRKPKG